MNNSRSSKMLKPTGGITSKLVKYDEPFMVTKAMETLERRRLMVQDESASSTHKLGAEYGSHSHNRLDAGENECHHTGATGEGSGDSSGKEAILEHIFPTETWTEFGVRWRQLVSRTRATRRGCIALDNELTNLLQEHNARETGICGVRRDLYSQCFDELIRQITIENSQRGLLLLRLRDEYQRYFRIIRSLYTSAAGFSLRKAVAAEGATAAIDRKIAAITAEKESLRKALRQLDAKIEATDREFTRKRKFDEKRHFETVVHMKQANNQLKQQLISMVKPTSRQAATATTPVSN